MNLSFRFPGLWLSLALLVAAPASADSIKLYDSYGSTNGGEFTAVVITPLPFVPIDLVTNQPGILETFCLEKNEYVAFDTEYWVTISTAAENGGIGGGSPDPLDPLTAYLYERFATGNLADYDYGTGAARAASADALQHVIWYIEEEEAKSWTDGDDSLMDKYYQNALTNAGTAIGDVRVMNLWGSAALRSPPAQDQLVLTPEPSVTILGLLGLGFLAWNRRRA
jgi:hypothetical protein